MNSNWFAVFVLLAFGLSPVHGQSPDDRYVHAYNLIQEADRLADSGQSRVAVTKYLEAQVSVKDLQAQHPDWNAPLVAYRLKYISNRIEPLTRKADAAKEPLPPSPAETAAARAARELEALQDQISRLNNQNSLLQAKLREALKVQPAAMDPRELTRAEQRIAALQKERDLLAVTVEQSRPKAGANAAEAVVTQGAVVSVLQKQNEELQKQIADLAARLKTVPGASAEETLRLKESLAALEASNRVMKEEQIAMESRLTDFVRQHGNAGARGAELEKQLAEAREAARTAKEERDAIVAKLNQVTRDLTDRDSRIRSTATLELERELEAIRAKLKIFEAKKVPFTSEELALFKQAPLKVATAETNLPMTAPKLTLGNSTPVPALTPPAASTPPPTQIADALRAVDTGRFDEAERKYRELLAADPKNVNLMNNLAATLMDQDKVADAEATLKAALAVDAQDAVSLYFMGGLKIRQEKFDEAFDFLSRSAAIDPNKPNTHFLLGQALIQQGNRGPAESALRKAIQLKPGWGDPHYLLAVLYATQEGDTLGLARYHYKQAISGGVARNAELEHMMDKKPAGNAPR